tara:strand:+ start:191 stop:856 length:666 start_codon:yes stop_codon:yes gene_type:complete
MANKEEVTKSGANKVTEGVHVNHSYDQFKKITYSNSTWRVNIYDTSELIRRAYLTMQRRVGDDGKVENYMQLQLMAQSSDGVELKEIQFNADGNSILTKNQYGWVRAGRGQLKKNKKVYKYRTGPKYGCHLTDAEIKTICDASDTNIRVVSKKGYIDIPDDRSEKAVEFLKCFYRECVDNEAYPEVAEVMPAKPKKKMQIPWWYWVIGILILGGIANLAGY